MTSQSDTLSLFSQAQVTPGGVITNPVLTAPLTLTFGVGGPTVLQFTQSPTAGNRGLIDFAIGLVGREANAGKMGYGAFGDTTCFDIVGAGAVSGDRRVHIYDLLAIGSPTQPTYGTDGSLAVLGAGAEFRWYDRTDTSKIWIGYNTGGNRFAFYSFGDAFGANDRMYLTAGPGDLADVWVFLSAGPLADPNGRGRLGMASASHARAFMGANLYNDAGGWHTETGTEVAGMWYVSSAGGGSAPLAAYSQFGAGALFNVLTADSVGHMLDINGDCHATAFPVSSDAKFKKNVKEIKGALDLVLALRPVSFSWKKSARRRVQNPDGEMVEQPLFPPHRDGRHYERTMYGFIAQEVQEVLPDIVSENNESLALDYDRMVAVLTGAVQELAVRVKTLEASHGA